MFGRSKWLIMIPAIILIPILLGMTPLNLFQKLGSGCVFFHDKQVQKCNPTSLNSQISPDDHLLANQLFVNFDHEATPSPYSHILNSDPKPSLGASEFAPLRC
jgi:hypothetical protein